MTYAFVKDKRKHPYYASLTQYPFTPTTTNNTFGATLGTGQWVINYIPIEYPINFKLQIPYVFAFVNIAYTTADTQINFALYDESFNLLYGHQTPMSATTSGRKDFNVSGTALENYTFKKGVRYYWAFGLGSNTGTVDATGRVEIVNSSIGITTDLGSYISKNEYPTRRIVSGFNGTNWDSTITPTSYTSTSIKNLLTAYIKDL